MQDFITVIIVSWILFRLFRPVIFVQWNKPKQRQYYSAPNQSPARQEESAVNKPSARNKNFPDDEGEYIDFEELPKS